MKNVSLYAQLTRVTAHASTTSRRKKKNREEPAQLSPAARALDCGHKTDKERAPAAAATAADTGGKNPQWHSRRAADKLAVRVARGGERVLRNHIRPTGIKSLCFAVYILLSIYLYYTHMRASIRI